MVYHLQMKTLDQRMLVAYNENTQCDTRFFLTDMIGISRIDVAINNGECYKVIGHP